MKTETIIILTPGFPKDETDSTCLPAQQLFVRVLKEQFPAMEIIIITFQYPYTSAEYNWYNCRVIALGGKGKGKIYRLFLWKRAWNKLQRISTEKNIAGILSFWCGECALIGHRFGKKRLIPHYCWILGQDAKKNNSYVQRIRPEAGELIAMSDFLQDSFLKNHSIKPTHVVTNGVDKKVLSTIDHERDILVLGAGSLIPLKQFEVFIEIIAGIKAAIPGVRAKICGKGPEEEKLKAMIKREGLEQNISLAGELPHDEVIQLMRRSLLFLHPSFYEGFSTVCLEALSTGCQVISFVQPMKQDIEHWQIAITQEDMLQKAIDVLQDVSTDHSRVSPYLMEDSVKKMMRLFSQH